MEPDLRRLADGLLKMLESERARVAGVLGDEVASVMTIARYLIGDAAQRLARGEAQGTSETLQDASARIRDATRAVIALCSQLRPKVLDDLGLLAALSSCFREFSRENRAILVSPRITVAEIDVPGELKLAIFRIVQAALSNVARHSKASAVLVYLSVFEGELRLGIEDNGVGFDVERLRYRRNGHDGCGLGIIQRWAEISGGRCSIDAIPRRGARVRAFWQLHVASATGRQPQEGSGVSAPPAEDSVMPATAVSWLPWAEEPKIAAYGRAPPAACGASAAAVSIQPPPNARYRSA
jgi:two-component system NarL family sensor kinase